MHAPCGVESHQDAPYQQTCRICVPDGLGSKGKRPFEAPLVTPAVPAKKTKGMTVDLRLSQVATPVERPTEVATTGAARTKYAAPTRTLNKVRKTSKLGAPPRRDVAAGQSLAETKHTEQAPAIKTGDITLSCHADPNGLVPRGLCYFTEKYLGKHGGPRWCDGCHEDLKGCKHGANVCQKADKGHGECKYVLCPSCHYAAKVTWAATTTERSTRERKKKTK